MKIQILPIQKHIRSHSNDFQARNLSRFFKTGKGQYGEGDIFLGIKVPISRQIAKQYLSSRPSLNDENAFWKELEILISSPYHEERLVALLILVEKFKKVGESEQTKIFKFYLKNTKYINNWDLVDLSAPKIVGQYLHQSEGKTFRKPGVLLEMAKSKDLWERRIAIVSTYYFIKQNSFDNTFIISEMLMPDKHDLIHKATGWMLREMGKQSVSELTAFLKKYYKIMPRTMLRYSIEKFPEEIRKAYIAGRI